MILVEQHQFSAGSKHYEELDKLCFLSKNLYNSTLYYVKQYYFKTGRYWKFSKLNALSMELFPKDYTALPAKVSQQTQRLVDSAFKSYFEHLKVKKPDERVKVPKYLDKYKGRQVVQYTKQAISFNNRNVPRGYLKLSGTSFYIKTKVDNVQSARIVPHNKYITVEICYNVDEPQSSNNDRYAGLDIGVNNLAVITSNCFTPVIVNGRPLKSINQFYNKKIAELNSNNLSCTKLMYSIIRKRNNKTKDYMHKSSAFVVNHLVSNNIGTLVIGRTKDWKQDMKIDRRMCKKDRQTFVQIPFYKFIQMLMYKCKLHGINVVLQEESYTSKASFINQDYIATYGVDDKENTPTGYRATRGLYKNKDCSDTRFEFINADVNGSYNILRKYLTLKEVWNDEIYSNCVEVCSTPSVYTVKL